MNKAIDIETVAHKRMLADDLEARARKLRFEADTIEVALIVDQRIKLNPNAAGWHPFDGWLKWPFKVFD